MSALPYMRWHVADYLADTRHLTRSEHGAYLLLLMSMWSAGGRLPADDGKLAKLALCSEAEWAEIRPAVMPYFKRRGGHISQKRMNREVAHVRAVVEQRKAAGRAGAAKKHGGFKGKALASAEHMPGARRHSQTQIQTPSEEGPNSPSSDRRSRVPLALAKAPASPAPKPPDHVREAFAAAKGPAWTASFIDPCGWTGEALEPAHQFAADRIEREAGAVLEGLKIGLVPSGGPQKHVMAGLVPATHEHWIHQVFMGPPHYAASAAPAGDDGFIQGADHP